MPSWHHLWHLVRRFVGSLWPGGPAAADDAWATAHGLSIDAAGTGLRQWRTAVARTLDRVE